MLGPITAMFSFIEEGTELREVRWWQISELDSNPCGSKLHVPGAWPGIPALPPSFSPALGTQTAVLVVFLQRGRGSDMHLVPTECFFSETRPPVDTRACTHMHTALWQLWPSVHFHRKKPRATHMQRRPQAFCARHFRTSRLGPQELAQE